jgi:hypothetical protein
LLFAGSVLASCSGAGSNAAAPIPRATANASSAGLVPVPKSKQLAAAKLKLVIPARSTSPGRRRPRYVPASTASVSVTVTAASAPGLSLPYTQSVNVAAGLSNSTVTCTAVSGGNYGCTISVSLPIGNDTVTISARDGASGAGNLLSQAVATQTIVVGAANTISGVTLDGNPGSITVTQPVAGVSGSTSSGFTVTEAGVTNFTVKAFDTHGTQFGTQSGVPSLKFASLGTSAATATFNGAQSQLTVTPVTSGTDSFGLYLVTPNGDGSTALTTLTAATGPPQLTLFVASSAGFSTGQAIVVDESTPNAELLTVAGTGPGQITLADAPLKSHAVGATLATVGTNGLGFVTQNLNVTIDLTLIGTGGCGASSCQVDDYTLGSNFVEKGAIGPGGFPNSESVNFLGFDSSYTLYNADSTDYTIEEFGFQPSTQWTSTALRTITSSVLAGNTDADVGLAVAPNGTVAVDMATSSSGGLNNPAGPQLAVYAPGATTPSFTHTFTNSGGTDWSAGSLGTQPSVAILTDSSGNIFGYAVALVNLNYGNGSTAANKIGIVFPDNSEASLTSGIGGNYSDPENPIVAWDQHLQALIYVDTASGNHHVLEFAYSGGTFGAGSTVTSLTGGAGDITVSRDGEIGVAFTPNGTSNAVSALNKATFGTDLALSLGSEQVNAIHFFPDDSLLLAGGTSNPNTLYDYASSGGIPTTTIFATTTPSDTPLGWESADAAITN